MGCHTTKASYWLFVKSLSIATHEIEYVGKVKRTMFETDVNYDKEK